MFDKIVSEKLLKAKAVFNLHDAFSKDESVFFNGVEFHFPRQTIDKGIGKNNYSLADFIGPSGDYLGSFAVTTGHGLESLVKKFEDQNDDYSSIMVKVIADRLAEALAERMHERVRAEFWGYGKSEDFDNSALIKEKYQGIRPAPGYPSCPDHKEKDKIWKLLAPDENSGITLTETRAMFPAASVCGWYFSHPDSKYFYISEE